MPGKFLFLPVALLALVSCSPQQDIRDFGMRELTMPNGSVIRVEALTDPTLMARGAMFRTSLPADRGLLYQYAQPGNYGFWMFQTTIPIDTIWMDGNRSVVEVIANMQPCASKSARECPHFGGRERSLYVLQLAGGQAEKMGVRVGSILTF